MANDSKNSIIGTKIDMLSDHFDSRMIDVMVRFDRVDDKFDKIDVRLDDANVTSVKQQIILDEHVKRTNTLQDTMSAMKSREVQIKVIVLIGKIAVGIVIATGGVLAVKELIKLIVGG